MKNLFCLLISLCSIIFLQAQQDDTIVNKREYGNQYFLSEPFENGCTELDIFVYQEEFDAITCFNTDTESLGGYWVVRILEESKIGDIAQPFYIDTTLNINIIGVSILSPYRYYLGRNGYLCIADSNLNIQRKTPIYDIPIPVETQQGFGPNSQPIWWLNYEEFFFDTSINMSGKFYVILDNPKPKPYTEYNWNNVKDRTNFHNMETYIASAQKPKYSSNPCPVTMEPLIRYVQIHNPNMTNEDFYAMTPDEIMQYSICKDTNAEVDYSISDTSWHDLTNDPYDTGNSIFKWDQRRVTAYYIFPIFDTITPNIDSSALEKINLENYTLIYPNPTNKEINIQCSFVINSIEIYNSVGGMIKKINNIKTNHYLLDLDIYEKGNYILRINTNAGTIEKKVVLQ